MNLTKIIETNEHNFITKAIVSIDGHKTFVKKGGVKLLLMSGKYVLNPTRINLFIGDVGVVPTYMINLMYDAWRWNHYRKNKVNGYETGKEWKIPVHERRVPANVKYIGYPEACSYPTTLYEYIRYCICRGDDEKEPTQYFIRTHSEKALQYILDYAAYTDITIYNYTYGHNFIRWTDAVGGNNTIKISELKGNRVLIDQIRDKWGVDFFFNNNKSEWFTTPIKL